jgi:hypothetical protein
VSRRTAAAIPLVLLSLAMPVSAETFASQPVPMTAGEPGLRHLTWDLDLNGGVGREFSDGNAYFGTARARTGVLWIREPRYYSLGATASVSSRLPLAFGVEAEYLNTASGFWIEPHAFLDVEGHPGGALTLGFGIFGLSGQVRQVEGGDSSTALCLLLRLPVRLLVWAFERRP